MKILVFIKEVFDIKIPLIYEETTGRLKADLNVSMLNPEDAAAIDTALKIKERISDAHITLIHLGPGSGEGIIRKGLAMGCDEGLRIWDDGLNDIHTLGKALIFTRIAKILTFDLILTGSKSHDTGNAQLGIFLAHSLNVPCISRVIILDYIQDKAKAIATKRLSHGYTERIESAMPLVATIEAAGEITREASLPALLEAGERDIPCYDLARIGIPGQSVRNADSVLSFGYLRFPVPRLTFIPAPDSSLTGYERQEKLREGTVKKRGGKLIKGEDNQIVEELFNIMFEEGWLDHLNKRG